MLEFAPCVIRALIDGIWEVIWEGPSSSLAAVAKGYREDGYRIRSSLR